MRRIAILLLSLVAAAGCDADAGFDDTDADVADASGEIHVTTYHYQGGPAALPRETAPDAASAAPLERGVAEVVRLAGRSAEASSVAVRLADEVTAASHPSDAPAAEVDGAPAAPKPWDPQAWVGMVHDRAVVLASADEVDAAWAAGEGSLRRVDAYERSWDRAVTVAALPASLRAWEGRPVRLYGRDGKVCEARVSKLSLRTVYRDTYADHPEDHDADLPPVRIAQQYGLPLLVGELDGWSDACGPAIYARSAMQPEPTVFQPRGELRGPYARLAVRAFRATDAWKEIARDNQTYMDPPSGPWDRFLGNKAKVFRHTNASTGREIWEVRALHGPLCGDPGGNLAVLLEVTRRGRKAPQLKPMAFSQDWLGFKALTDLDGDGTPELIGDDGSTIYKVRDGVPERLDGVEVPDYGWSGCPC